MMSKEFKDKVRARAWETLRWDQKCARSDRPIDTEDRILLQMKAPDFSYLREAILQLKQEKRLEESRAEEAAIFGQLDRLVGIVVGQ